MIFEFFCHTNIKPYFYFLGNRELLSQIESLKPSQVITEESKVTKRKPKSEVVIDETGGSSKINTTTSTRTEFGGTF